MIESPSTKCAAIGGSEQSEEDAAPDISGGRRNRVGSNRVKKKMEPKLSVPGLPKTEKTSPSKDKKGLHVQSHTQKQIFGTGGTERDVSSEASTTIEADTPDASNIFYQPDVSSEVSTSIVADTPDPSNIFYQPRGQPGKTSQSRETQKERTEKGKEKKPEKGKEEEKPQKGKEEKKPEKGKEEKKPEKGKEEKPEKEH